jgi:hypothetical protein
LKTIASAVLLDRQPFDRVVRWRTVAKVLSCLERKKGAEPQEDDGCCDDRAGELANSGGNRGESGWKKHSGKATQDEQPATEVTSTGHPFVQRL